MPEYVEPGAAKTPKELFDEHQYLVRHLAGYFARKCRNMADYEELLQWGLIGLWDGCTRWTGPSAEFHIYAYTRVKGQILDGLRSCSPFSRRQDKANRPRFTDIDDSELLVAEGMPSDELLHMKREIQKIINMLTRLTPNERRIFVQHFVLGKSLVQIAQDMKLSGPRISQLKRRAVEKLIQKAGIQL